MSVDHEERLKPILYDEEPSEELLEWARIHINENPDTKDQLVSELRDMIFGKKNFWDWILNTYICTDYSFFGLNECKDGWIFLFHYIFTEKGECIPDRSDDEYFLQFLRARNFDVKRAHKLVG